jgi:hypothetical protein
MIVCKECGAHNADADVFCGGCGDVLEWTGEKIVKDVVADDAEVTTDEPKRKLSLHERMSKVLYADVAPTLDRGAAVGPTGTPGASGPPGASGAPGTARPPSTVGLRPAGPPSSSGPPSTVGLRPAGPPSSSGPPSTVGLRPAGPPDASDTRQIALALAVPASARTSGTVEQQACVSKNAPVTSSAPVDETRSTNQSVQPQAIQPQMPARRKPPRVAPGLSTRTPQQGDLICGDCGEANIASRKFCSRCGSSLSAAVVVKITWWRRLFPRRGTRRAGERPWQIHDAAGGKKKAKRRGGAKVVQQARRIMTVILVLGGALYAIHPPFRQQVDTIWASAKTKVTRAIHPQYDPVSAGPGTSSNEAPLDPAHPATMAVDGFKNTYWVAASPSPESRPELAITLAEPTDLARIIVHNGASDNFQGFDRPRTLVLIFDNGVQESHVLKDAPGPQTLTIHHGQGATRFRIVITDVYPSIDGTALALTEIEMFRRR